MSHRRCSRKRSEGRDCRSYRREGSRRIHRSHRRCSRNRSERRDCRSYRRGGELQELP